MKRYFPLLTLTGILLLVAMILGVPTMQAQAPVILINEVDADQTSTDSAEFIELYDGGVGNTDLAGLALVLYNGSDNLSYIAFDLDGQATDGDGYFVLCGNAANVANCDLDVSPDTGLIQNGEDAVALLVGDAANYPNDTALPVDGDIVDAIVYETGSDANSGLLVLLNAGQSVVDEGGGGDQTGHSNQRCPDGIGGARNTDTYDQHAPTPGAENTCPFVPPPPPVDCTAAIPIADVQGPGDSTPFAGQSVTIRGFITADFGSEIFVQENSSAARTGVLVFSSGNSASRGDEVCVSGIASEFFDQTQVGGNGSADAAVGIVSSGNPLPAPAVVTTGAIATGSPTAEDWEGVLVKVENVIVANEDLGFGEWSVDDTSGAVRVDDLGSYSFTPTLGETLGFVQGPLYYSFGDYKIEPRDNGDIGLPVPCAAAIPIADVQGPGDSTPLAGQEVTILGFVTADFGGEIVVQENSSAARSGVLVFSSGNTASRGDEVCVTGVASERFGQTQVGGNNNPNATIDILSSGNPLPAPAVVTTGAIATGSPTAEDWEGVLVKVENVTVADEDLGFGEWSVDDTSGAVRVDDKGSYSYAPTLSEPLDFVIGPLFYGFSNYKIEPRDDADIGLVGASNPQPRITEIMYDPASSEDNWEWIEVYNAGIAPLYLSGWIVDDGNGIAHPVPNIGSGSIPVGETGILFNVDDVNAIEFGAAWGIGINLIPVTNWSAMGLNNTGDKIGLWDSFSSYSGDNQAHANVIEGVTYTDDSPWPDSNNSASINVTTLAGDNNDGANWALSVVGSATPTFTAYQTIPLAGNSGGDVGSPGDNPPVIGKCGDPATYIHDVQGPGFVSPIVGEIVTVEGVVVGDFQEGNELNGLFIQEEFTDFDADINTSEGVFIFEGSFAGPDVNEGDLVRVTGEVDEFKTLTQLKNIGIVLLCDYAPGPYGPVDVTLPEEIDGDLEKVEGMNVDVMNTMSVAQNFFLGRYGQLTLSSDLTNRLFQPTNQVLPNTIESAALADYNARNLLFLDDGVDVSRCGDNPVPVPYLGPAPPAVLRGGDQVSNLTGVLDYGQINSAACSDSSTLAGRDYRLHPTQDPVFSTENPRTSAPDDVGGSLKVVSFNVLNFFNGDGQGGGFPTSRGADTFNEFVRQRIKIFEAMKAIDGDIVGLMEIENDGFDEYSAIAELVKVLNEGPCWDSADECSALGYADTGLGAGTYDYIDAGPGIIGDDAITVGFIYKPASVTPNGSPLVVDETAFTDPNNTGSSRNRPAIAQTFDYADGDTFTAIVNHLKSKGSPCGPGDDDPEQASCNVTRTLAAQYLIDIVVPAVQASSGDPDVMIMGDLNAYAMEDPIRALTDGGFINLVKEFNGDYAYSYTFDGMVGYLDHSLANSSLTALVTGVTEWHINTDEPAVINYDEDFNPPGYYSPDAYRASDHDPVIAGICEGTPPAVTVTVDPDSLWPPNHQYVNVTATVEVTDFDPNATITLLSVTSNEPDNGLGDGDTPDDIVIIDDYTFDLRAERSGTGDGRVYTITYEVTDSCGNSTIASAEVTVPKDKGKRGE